MVIVQYVEHMPSLLAASDKPGRAEGPELVGNCGYTYIRLLRKFTDAFLTAEHRHQEEQPRRISHLMKKLGQNSDFLSISLKIFRNSC